MIKFMASEDDGTRPVIGFGLSRLNCQRLLAGQPIRIKLAEMLDSLGRPVDLAEVEVLLFAGHTEESMIADLKRQGIDLPIERRPCEEDHQQKPPEPRAKEPPT